MIIGLSPCLSFSNADSAKVLEETEGDLEGKKHSMKGEAQDVQEQDADKESNYHVGDPFSSATAEASIHISQSGC